MVVLIDWFVFSAGFPARSLIQNKYITGSDKSNTKLLKEPAEGLNTRWGGGASSNTVGVPCPHWLEQGWLIKKAPTAPIVPTAPGSSGPDSNSLLLPS